MCVFVKDVCTCMCVRACARCVVCVCVCVCVCARLTSVEAMCPAMPVLCQLLEPCSEEDERRQGPDRCNKVRGAVMCTGVRACV